MHVCVSGYGGAHVGVCLRVPACLCVLVHVCVIVHAYVRACECVRARMCVPLLSSAAAQVPGSCTGVQDMLLAM